ncbi:aminotransferase class V-fold PLP-dependent enzyme [Roseburia sp. 831b]|uniref:aminotransferase class V-fold PLP-dependent enzyme n=1 Tax=Roseburia sp. 831b TaxID=1261635 RepID=UPI0009511306|nr:aminotransferase class V-fold PLP-dependent enzyme [Roseburia sp. 831b]WVK74157.1 aminotransferase class V-fold PLP-dependent enzyme [Roseburia sp. 831b]
MIYLDNAATTYPKSENVYRALDEANRENAFNSGRGSYKAAREATAIIDDAKNKLRKLANASDNSDVILTPSITVAMNQILQGLDFHRGDIVYMSPYEHNAVARVLHLLEKRIGIIVKELPLLPDTLEIDLETTKYLFAKDKPICVCCTHVSNVTGYILPIKEIFESAKRYNSYTVLDTAQSFGLIEIEKDWKIDFLAFAGHKTLYGPLGVGGFINYHNHMLQEVIVGGTGSDSLNLDMPIIGTSRYEASSANVVAVKGLSVALEEALLKESYETEKELLKYLVDKLQEIDNIRMFLPPEDKHIGMVSFVVEGYKSEDVGMILDEDYDIAVRTGYHCAPNIHKWLKDEEYLGTVRVGLSKFNSRKDIDLLCDALEMLCS